MEPFLNLQADRIEAALQELGIANRVRGRIATDLIELRTDQIGVVLQKLASNGRVVLQTAGPAEVMPRKFDIRSKFGRRYIMQMLLELQADRIEATLQEYGVSGQVHAGVVLPRVVVFRLQTGRGQRIAEIQGLREELAMRLGVPGIIISRNDGDICLEVPREDAKVITLGTMLARLTTTPPSQTALLGMSNQGEPLIAHFPSPNVAHVLIAGMTGSGKTELLRTMLVSLSLWSSRRDTMIYLIDPKGQGLGRLGRLRSVVGVCDSAQAPGLLDRLLGEMERRGSTGGNNHIYVVIDELADLVMVDKAIAVALTRLVQRGREAGIHVIAATQRPSAQVVAGLMRANFPVRITAAVNSAAEAAIASGMPRTGAELLLGKGDMILVYQGKIERFQVCLFAKADEPLVSHLFRDGVDRLVHVGKPASLTARLRERLQIRSPGRPEKGYTKEMVEFAMGQIAATGDCSQRALRQWHREECGSDVNPPRASAAIEEARRRLDLAQQVQGQAE